MEKQVHIKKKNENFTMIPNIVYDTCDANEIALYSQIRRKAGEDGSCYMSDRSMTKAFKIGLKSLKKAYKGLIDKKMIEQDGWVTRTTNGGNQQVRSYVISDIWGRNELFYKGAVQGTHLKEAKVHPEVSKGASKRATNKIPLTISQLEHVAEKPATDKKPLKDDGNEPMDRVEFVKWCRASPLRHIQLIAEYADEKKIDFNTKAQWREFIKRNVRAARVLSPYTDEQIAKAMSQIEKATQGERGYITRWTLETLVKYLDQ